MKRTIPLAPFNTRVVVYVGEYKKSIKHIESIVPAVPLDLSVGGAYTLELEDDGLPFYVMSFDGNVSPNAIYHECIHVVDMLTESFLIDCWETRAYLGAQLIDDVSGVVNKYFEKLLN